jgi:hypothetical protein
MEDSQAPRLPRKAVSKEKLLRILTERMQQVPARALRSVFRLQRPDENGCNWVFEIASPSSLNAMYEILANARLEFNLTEE